MASKRALPLLSRQLEQHSIQALRPLSSIAPRNSLSNAYVPLSQTSMPRVRMRQPKRHFTTTLVAQKEDSSSSSSAPLDSGIAPSILYTFEDINSLTSSPHPNRILIDVREPSELVSTGYIPGSRNIPISTSPDAFFLPADEFEDKYGFPRPGKDDEVIFYCKAGVRSKAAARLAGQSGFGGKIGEFPGSWMEWAEKGGAVEGK